MIITKLFKDTYQIKMPNQIIDIYNQVKVKELTKEIIKKINKKNKLYGLTYLEIYQDINYGTIIKVKNDKTIYYKKDEIEIKIIIHTDTPLLYKIDYFDIKKDYKNKIYYYKNIAILFAIIFVWLLILKENKKFNTYNKIYKAIDKEKNYI